MDTYHKSSTSASDPISSSPFEFDNTWIKGSVKIALPYVKQKPKASVPTEVCH